MAVILLIEDDAPVRTIIRRMLERRGHDVIEAPDGDTGIELYSDNSTDLVITDIIMPKKEGLETIKEIRRIDPDVKIIAISGGGKVRGSYYLDLAVKFGAKRTFEKPFTWKELTDTVAELLSEDDASSK